MHYKTNSNALTLIYNTYNSAEEGTPYSSHCWKGSFTFIQEYDQVAVPGCQKVLFKVHMCATVVPSGFGLSSDCRSAAHSENWAMIKIQGESRQITSVTCLRCFLSSPASGSGRGGRISALVGAITCRHILFWALFQHREKNIKCHTCPNNNRLNNPNLDIKIHKVKSGHHAVVQTLLLSRSTSQRSSGILKSAL